MKKNKRYFAVFSFFLIGIMLFLGVIYSAVHKQPADDGFYNGTYNEEVLRKLNQDVVIGKQHISLPCTLQELGEDFSFQVNSETGEDVQVFQSDVIWTILYYRGNPFAQIYYMPSQEEDHDYSCDPILEMNIFGEDTNWSVGGIVRGKTTMQQVVEKLGNPWKYYSNDEEYKTLVYGENRLQIMFKEDNLVDALWMLVNTDTPREKPTEIIPFDGKWHEGSLEQLNQDFIVNGRSFPMPFSVDDLGLNFELSRDPYTGIFDTEEVPGTDAVMLDLMFNGDMLGRVLCASSQDPHHDYRADPVRAVFFKKSMQKCSFTIPGLEPGELTEEELIQKLGRPEWDYWPEYEQHLIIYENQGFVARIDQDGIVDGIYMEDPAHRLTSISMYVPQDDFYYNGSCDQETINHLAQTIRIQGQPINIYDGREALGDFAQALPEESDSEDEFIYLKLNEETLGLAIYQREQDHIKSINIFEPVRYGNHNIYWLSAGNILLSATTEKDVIEMLGEPDKRTSDGFGLSYGNGRLQINLSTTGKVRSIFLDSNPVE